MRGRTQGKPQHLQVKAATDSFWMPLMPLAVGVVDLPRGLLMFYHWQEKLQSDRPLLVYNSKTGKPDTTGAGDLGTLRARVLGLGQRT